MPMNKHATNYVSKDNEFLLIGDHVDKSEKNNAKIMHFFCKYSHGTKGVLNKQRSSSMFGGTES